MVHSNAEPAGPPAGDDPFALQRDVADHRPSDQVLAWTAAVRPAPAVFVTGVMVRSGTQYVSNLLGLHPHLVRHPRDVWELPLLRRVGDLQGMTARFFSDYPFNRDRLGDQDLMALLGAGVLGYLQAGAAPGMRILLTHPGSHYLDWFFALFPHEHLLLLMRDGRDVVASADRTWPKWGFERIVRIWNDNARMMLQARDVFEQQGRRFLYRTYEDVVADPAAFVREVCAAFELDPDVFRYPAIQRLLVKGSSTFEPKAGQWEARHRGEEFKPVGRWRDWDDREKALFKDIAGATLVAAGYAADLSW